MSVKIIAIDPGGTTGYCEASIEEATFTPAGKQPIDLTKCYIKPYQIPDDCEDLWNRLAAYSPDWIVMESFEYRRNSRGGLDLTPVKLIGIAELYAAKSGCRLVMQTPAQGKGYYTDTQLKNKGLYKRGLGHGMDATRHLLQWLTFGAGFQYLKSKKIEDFVEMKTP